MHSFEDILIVLSCNIFSNDLIFSITGKQLSWSEEASKVSYISTISNKFFDNNLYT